MSQFYSLTSMQIQKMLVSFCDLTSFVKMSCKLESSELFQLLDEYFEFVGDIIEGAGGYVVKFMGDAFLVVFPDDLSSTGIKTLIRLKRVTDEWMRARGYTNSLEVKVHYGPVACGPSGTKGKKRFDIYGETVNICAALPSHGLSLTPQAFGQLDADGRKLFKKHTPAITYVPVDEKYKR